MPYGVDGKHFPLNTNYRSQWNKEIPLQETIEEPSDALKGRLYAIVMTNENKQKKPREGDSQERPTPTAALTPAHHYHLRRRPCKLQGYMEFTELH